MMAKKLDPAIASILQQFGFGTDAAWDCHGTWVVYHRVLEQLAARAGIAFDAPIPLEANGAARSVALCVTGRMGDKTEWSIGEASPANNKNGYPYAMAEKRAKDRVVLKLIGLHGLAYSEDEADDFVPPATTPTTAAPTAQNAAIAAPKLAPEQSRALYETLTATMRKIGDAADLDAWGKQHAARINELNDGDYHLFREGFGIHRRELAEAAKDRVPA